MADELIELPGGDIAPLLPMLDGAKYVNLQPGVDEDAAPPAPGGLLGGLFSSRGPLVPLATWTPGEIGLQHGVGQHVTRFLAEHGTPVPEEWYVASEHPRRGLVVRTYQYPASATLPWLVAAAAAVCPLEITGPWRAVVSR